MDGPPAAGPLAVAGSVRQQNEAPIPWLMTEARAWWFPAVAVFKNSRRVVLHIAIDYHSAPQPQPKLAGPVRAGRGGASGAAALSRRFAPTSFVWRRVSDAETLTRLVSNNLRRNGKFSNMILSLHHQHIRHLFHRQGQLKVALSLRCEGQRSASQRANFAWPRRGAEPHDQFVRGFATEIG